MSINTAHANGGVLIFSGERILLYCDGVEMAFEPSSIPHFKGNKHGTVYLTTHRVIFNNKDKGDMLQSFSLSFGSMREVELEQPVFGANYIKGKMVAELGGNWSGAGRFKMWFKSGGAIEFGQAMLRAGQLGINKFYKSQLAQGKLTGKFELAPNIISQSSRNRQSFPEPPAYTPHQGPFYQAPPPAYSAPHTEYYAWVPYQTFPSAPPASSVYMTEAPPPYPGVDPNFTPYPPPPQQNGYPPSSKAQEAATASSAYYNPSYPHNVYMPSAPPPPSYDEVTKKYN